MIMQHKRAMQDMQLLWEKALQQHQHGYDSDEEVDSELGTWEHQLRRMEMDKTRGGPRGGPGPRPPVGAGVQTPTRPPGVRGRGQDSWPLVPVSPVTNTWSSGCSLAPEHSTQRAVWESWGSHQGFSSCLIHSPRPQTPPETHTWTVGLPPAPSSHLYPISGQNGRSS